MEKVQIRNEYAKQLLENLNDEEFKKEYIKLLKSSLPIYWVNKPDEK